MYFVLSFILKIALFLEEHRWQQIYTAAGSDGMDKSQLWDGP